MSEVQAQVGMRRRRGSGTVWLCVWLLGRAMAAEATPAALLPAGNQSVTLAAGASRDYRVELAPGRAVELSLRQQDATLQLSVTDLAEPAAVPLLLQSDAGRSSRIRLTFLATTQSSAWQIRLSARKPTVAATALLQLGAAHPAGPIDRARAQAQRALAAAEVLRRAADAATQPATRAAYQAAADAAAPAHDGCLQRVVAIGRARFEAVAGDYLAARSAATTAVQSTCDEDVAEQAQAYKSLGLALGYLGEYAQAAVAEQQALALYRRSGDRYYQGVLQGNLSAVYRELGQTQAALDAAAAALQLAQALDDRQGVIFSRESIAAIRLSRGELAPALAHYRQTLDDIAKTPYPMVEAQAWNDLGIVYRRLGEDTQSQAAYQHAVELWQASDNRNGLAETLLNQAEALLAQDQTANAAGLLERALQLARDGGFRSEQAHALRGLGRIALRKPDFASAQQQLGESQQITGTIGELGGQAYAAHALGDLALARGDPVAARRTYSEALTLALRADDSAEQAEVWAALARLEATAGALPAAQAAIEHALEIVETQRARIDDSELRTDYFAVQRGYYELCIDVLMRRDANTPGAGYAAAALEVSERARARSLQDLLAERRIEIDRGIDPALLRGERAAEEHLHRLAWLASSIAAGAGGGASSAGSAPQRARDTGLDDAARELDRWRGRIRAANPRYAELVRPRRPRLAELQRELLDSDSTVFEFWLGNERSYLWRITRSGLQGFALPPRAELEADADALRARILARAVAPTVPLSQLAEHDSAESAAIAGLAHALATRLHFDAPPLPQQQIVVIADGALLTLPFDLLRPAPAPDVVAAVAADVVYLPSLAALGALRALPRRSVHRAALAIVADPVFRADDPRLRPAADAPPAAGTTRSTRALDLGQLPPLPQAHAEATGLATLAGSGSTMTLGFAANRAAVSGMHWADYRVAHFATHAVLDLAQPALSGIVLSLYDEQAQAQDGFLRVSDLYNLSLPVDMVVLSVCDAALGKRIGSEGAFSLARAFFYAGARRVVASLWPVDDRASLAFMQYFYHAYLIDQATPQVALAEAQRRMQADARWQAPLYWAGFVLQGDWR